MTILDALVDRALLGALPAFRDLGTWRAWLAFLRAVYGLPMDAEDLTLYQKHTGRTRPREGGYAEACAIVGRQSGKTAIAATVGAFEAVVSEDRGAHVLLVAQDLRGAQRALVFV